MNPGSHGKNGQETRVGFHLVPNLLVTLLGALTPLCLSHSCCKPRAWGGLTRSPNLWISEPLAGLTMK